VNSKRITCDSVYWTESQSKMHDDAGEFFNNYPAELQLQQYMVRDPVNSLSLRNSREHFVHRRSYQ
jgi:hypothetical protein